MSIQWNTSLALIALVSAMSLVFYIDPVLTYKPNNQSLEEDCDNAIDDDNDGLIDLNDPDCVCEIIEPVSLIPNPSFEDLDCCPFQRSQLDCAVDWIQASEPTTDLIHMCDWMGWDEFPPPLPFPDGEGIMGFRDGRVPQNNPNAQPFWKEYAGACLISPLQADSTYLFEFDLGFVSALRSPPINISFFGTTDCDNLPFGVGNQAFGCPTNGPNWVRLGSKVVSGGSGNQWVKVNLEVIPQEDIAAIAIGPDCPAVLTSVSLYYFFDNLLLADFNSFDFQIRTASHPCQEDYTLRVPFNPMFSYQWYKDGIALPEETSEQLTVSYGEGNYQVRIDDGMSCRVSANFNHQVPVLGSPLNVTICKDASYTFGSQLLTQPGTYVETFTSADNCDSIVYLDLKVLGVLADTVDARIFEGEKYEFNGSTFTREGDYLLTLRSSLGCDSLVQLQLRYFNVFIPNVFSPNYDGLNDNFKVFSESGLIENVDLKIYDRWGAMVFAGEEWDGTNDGEPVMPGTYVYVFRLRMSDGIERQFSGSVLVLK